ncbi:hypothetical protein WDJ51_02540 [Rathayibacter sp. YIM 133350]|uniref:hypothetical protein n=1 Tax=Rathayibacter sp. YIM 133350 TaxID=3131992 RepID=UPI00307DEA19
MLIAFSILVGVAAGWLISLAPWAILAALLLTLSTVGMGVGVLWTLRPSWSEKTWPPSGPDRPADVRARRSLRALGIVLLAPLPVLVAGLGWSIAVHSFSWQREPLLALFVLAYATAGVWLLRLSRVDRNAIAPHDSYAQRPADGARPHDREGWRRLGGPLKGNAVTAASAPSVIVFLVVPVELLLILDDVPGGIAIWIAIVAVGAVIGLVILRRYRAPVDVNLADELIRIGGKTMSWADLTRAELLAYPPWEGSPRTLVLTLGDHTTLRGRVVLRRREHLELSEEETQLALRVIDASAIELPRDKDDPRGRFSRQLHPSSLTKAEASALILRPPAMDENLPIGTNR